MLLITILYRSDVSLFLNKFDFYTELKHLIGAAVDRVVIYNEAPGSNPDNDILSLLYNSISVYVMSHVFKYLIELNDKR